MKRGTRLDSKACVAIPRHARSVRVAVSNTVSTRDTVGIYLPANVQDGYALLPNIEPSARRSTLKGLLDLTGMNRWNQKGARFALDALLLLTFPLLLTFTKLVELPALAEEVHQLLRLR